MKEHGLNFIGLTKADFPLFEKLTVQKHGASTLVHVQTRMRKDEAPMATANPYFAIICHDATGTYLSLIHI